MIHAFIQIHCLNACLLLEKRKNMEKKGTVLIVGAGRSGRGMLGELFDADNYQIVFADNDSQLVEGLRRQNYYTVQMSDLSTNVNVERRIENFEILDTIKDHEAYIKQIIEADIVCTALKPDAFAQVAMDLAEAVNKINEMKIDKKILVTLGANYVGLYKRFDELIRNALKPELIPVYEAKMCLIMSIVNRKNLLPDARNQTEDPYRIIGDNKPVLRVEDVPELHALKPLPDFFRLEKNLDLAMVYKIWTGNLVQCSMAFVALKDGIEYTNEAAHHPKASPYAYYAAVEGYNGVAAEYGLPPRSEEAAKKTVTIFRNEAFQDSLYRIAREPIRKFGRNDRFLGPAFCCIRHDIVPYYITKCLAYGFFYYNENDEQSIELKKMIEDKGIEQTILKCCDLHLERKEDSIIYQLIVNAYYEILGKNPLDE